MEIFKHKKKLLHGTLKYPMLNIKLQRLRNIPDLILPMCHKAFVLFHWMFLKKYPSFFAFPFVNISVYSSNYKGFLDIIDNKFSNKS